MSILSKACEYGIRAAVYVSNSVEGREFVPIREIADELKLSFHFLTKILQQLTEGGLMKSYRGPKGGVALAKPAAKVSLREIVTAIDGDGVFKDCILGLDGCGEKAPCPLHAIWAGQRKLLVATMEQTSLKDLSAGLNKGKIRLAND